MRNLIWVSMAVMLLLFGCTKSKKSEVLDQNAFLADPTIFYWEGTYYLYGTAGIMSDNKINPDSGFLVYTSTDLKNWEGPKGVTDGFALKTGDSYGTKGFWAPQVFHYKDKFYMAYTANSQIAIASAPGPLGPFTQQDLKPISTVTRQIDPYIFFDDDGRIYMYHVRLLEGNRLFVARIDETLSELDETTLTECIFAEANTWEDTQNAEWKVAEGPTVLKENGKYYFFYSANDFRNIDYAIGYATATSPYGPWIKNEQNPIIDRRIIGQNGPGHGDTFFTENNEMYYVLHTHYSDEKVAPRRTAIVRLEKDEEGFRTKPETFRFLNIK